MAKIEYSKLAEMVRKKLVERGVSENDVNADVIKTISETIRGIANEDYKEKVPEANQEPEEEEVVSVDVSSNEETPQETPGEEPDVITQSTEVDEELARKQGALEQKEIELREKERELERKAAELERKLEDAEYKPELPEALENVGPEKLFVFDMSKLSSGAESLSKLPMKLIDNPEKETTMKELWLEKAKKKAEVFVVKFEKVGEVIFNPFEGTSELMNFKDENPDNNINDLQNDIDVKTVERREIEPENQERTEVDSDIETGNMKDSIEPVKNVSKPMTNDMGLSVNFSNMSLEDIIKQYLKSKEQNG